uniref:Transcriptional regulator, AbrB family n=2 Tax=Candidatus Bipolaricaulota TaxID=67810 RepID=H5SNN0_9BACT|nr:transcriptional regulator, AbrB family [uncultured Acetothermia bacterium]BAL59094.1 transcriptional regulator, AbrB family [Candidatus Acetothermum autotrophicum]
MRRKQEASASVVSEKSTVTVRGQTVVPTAIRKKLQIGEGTKLEWSIEGGTIRIRPLPADPIAALEGILEGSGITDFVLRGRQQERAREAKNDEAP